MRVLKKKIVNDNIVLDVFITCNKLRHVQVILKNTVFMDLQSIPPKRPPFAANDVEGVEYRRLHYV